MSTFIIHTHGRLQEWVAEEKGYFAAEGLTDYALSSHGLLSPDHVRANLIYAGAKYIGIA